MGSRLALGVAVGSIIGCCGPCCGLGDDSEKAKEEQIEQHGHDVIPVPPEILETQGRMEKKYQQNLKLRADALQGECRSALNAQKCVEEYTFAHREDGPNPEGPEKKPETDPENSSSGEHEVEPTSPGATTSPEPTVTSERKTALKPINPETLFTASQNGSYKLEDGTFLEGEFIGQGTEGTFVGKITTPKKAVLSGKATYTERSKGGWTGWVRSPDFIVTPYGQANISYVDKSTLAFAFTDSHDGRVDYTKPATYTPAGGTPISLEVFTDADASTTAWSGEWIDGRNPNASCEPLYRRYSVDPKTYQIENHPAPNATKRTDCTAQ